MRARKLLMMLLCSAVIVPAAVMAQQSDTTSANGTSSARTDNQKSADRALQKAVRRALGKAPGFDSSGVFVRARGGAVTLSGSVRSGDQIQVAENVTRSVKGVNSVTNKLGLFHGGNG